MSEPMRILLVGATGLVGRSVMGLAVGRTDLRLLALSRREVAMPMGARMEVLMAPTEGWREAIAAIAPDRVICCLGTTIKKQGGEQDNFAAVDRDLVLQVARDAKEAGVGGFVVVSSVGADAQSKNFYLRTKGQMEERIAKVGLRRLDILRPGLLKGARANDARALEKLGMIASPLTDLFLRGNRRQYRSIPAVQVAAAAMQATREKAAGKFVHRHDEMLRLVRRWEQD